MALFTPLSAAGITAVAERFDLGAVIRVEPLWAGTVNSNFRFETSRGIFFVRINEEAGVDDVAYEAALVTHLADAGVPTPRAIAAVGEGGVAIDGRLYTVFPWVDGEHRDPGPAECAELGRALATLHLAARDFPLRRESRYAFPRIVERWQKIAAREDLPDDVESALGEVGIVIDWLNERQAERAALPAGVIHGDLFPDNVLFATDGERGSPRLAALIDFEQASDGTFAYDLAVSLCAWCWKDRSGFDHRIGALLAGYETVRTIEPAERAGLYIEMHAAAMRFTVTRITDVALNPAASAETRKLKSFRDYEARIHHLHMMGAAGLESLTRE